MKESIVSTEKQTGAISIIKGFYQDVASHKGYWIPVLLISLLAYGISFFNNTISPDDFTGEYYSGWTGAMVATGRWGMEIWHDLIGTSEYSPYIFKFVAFFSLIFSAFLLCAIFYGIHHNNRIYPYTFLAITFIVYPLLAEIWEYTGANVMVCGNMVLVMFSILYQLFSNDRLIKKSIISGLMLVLVASSYPVGMFVYITTVFAILFYRYCVIGFSEKPSTGSWLKQGLRFVPALVIATVLYLIIGFLLIKIINPPTPVYTTGDTAIHWLELSSGQLMSVIKSFALLYVLNALVYLPISIWLTAVVFFVICCFVKAIKRRSLTTILLAVLLVISQFALTILQLNTMPYRTAQTFSVFISFVVFLICRSSAMNRKALKGIVIVGFSLLSVYQATYTSLMLQWNQQRSENEVAVVRQLGHDLSQKGKKAVFCGEYYRGDYLTKRITPDPDNIFGKSYIQIIESLSEGTDGERIRFTETIGESFIYSAYERDMLQKMMSYCGYDIEFVQGLEHEDYLSLAKQAEELGMKPLETRDMGDYVLVYLGPYQKEHIG